MSYQPQSQRYLNEDGLECIGTFLKMDLKVPAAAEILTINWNVLKFAVFLSGFTDQRSEGRGVGTE